MTPGTSVLGSRRAVGIALLAAAVSAAPCHGQDEPAPQPYPPDPTASRLFFGPTGRALAAGSGYVGVYAFLMPVAQVGVTDRFSLGGGTPVLFPAVPSCWITPKVQLLRGPRAQAATGLVYVYANGDETEHMAIGYAVATFGSMPP